MLESETARAELNFHGQIVHMTFPPGWVEGPAHEFRGGPGTRSFREFHPAVEPEATLCFYYRGLPCSEEAGQIFHRVLELPPHMLSASEIKSLSEVLRDKAQSMDFNLASARTEDWNGRRVLFVEGRYRQIQEDTMAMFIDADGTGRAVQEVYFQAPKDKYLRYLRESREAMKSIEWKNRSRK